MDQIQLHEYTIDNGDSLSSISLDDGAFIANVLDASDLLASDSELSEDDAAETSTKDDVKFAFSDKGREEHDEFDPTSSIDSFTSEVTLDYSIFCLFHLTLRSNQFDYILVIYSNH